MEIAVKATYAIWSRMRVWYRTPTSSILWSSALIRAGMVMPNRLSLKPAAYSSRLWR